MGTAGYRTLSPHPIMRGLLLPKSLIPLEFLGWLFLQGLPIGRHLFTNRIDFPSCQTRQVLGFSFKPLWQPGEVLFGGFTRIETVMLLRAFDDDGTMPGASRLRCRRGMRQGPIR
jgi:hypothetical protein